MINAIEINNVTKIIKKNVILSNINLTMEGGKVYGLCGYNGAGKSMLLRLIAGLIRPTSGTVTVFGKRLDDTSSFPDSMGVIIENIGFWPYYSGFENLKILASINGIITDDEIKIAILRVGLDPNDKRKYNKYSLGMKQRLGIAQAIMEKPNLILLDEPTNALDENGRELVHKIIREENARGATIVLSSHIKEDLTMMCDHCYQMTEGKLLEGEIAL